MNIHAAFCFCCYNEPKPSRIECKMCCEMVCCIKLTKRKDTNAQCTHTHTSTSASDKTKHTKNKTPQTKIYHLLQSDTVCTRAFTMLATINLINQIKCEDKKFLKAITFDEYCRCCSIMASFTVATKNKKYKKGNEHKNEKRMQKKQPYRLLIGPVSKATIHTSVWG